MLIEITYNVTDVYMSTTETPVYVEISFEQPGGGAAVWGSITGTLSDQTDLQNALNAKVPYSGATQDVSLGEYGINVGNVIYDTTPTGIPTEQGATYWDADAETVALIMNGTIQKVGEDTFYHVRNTTGSTIAKGTAVRFSGTTGNSGRLLIAPMLADGTHPSQYYMGITSEAIANNADGKVYHFGKMRNINTSAFADGDVLYVSPSVAGALTATAPVAPNNIIVAAAVVHAANNGTLMIRTTLGSNINADEGVLLTTPTANQGLFYDSGLWVNKSITSALGYTPVPTTRNITINGVTYDLSADRTWTIAAGISGSGAAGQVTYWTGSSAVSGSNNLFWDNTNGRLGIGTNAPAATISISGNYTSGVANDLLSISYTHSIYNNGFFTFRQNYNSTQFNISNGTSVSSISQNGTALTINTQNTGSITLFSRYHYYNTSLASGLFEWQFQSVAAMRLHSTGNLVLGGTVSLDNGQRLQVIGDTLLRGSGATNATSALTVQNSDGTQLLRLQNQFLSGANTGLQIGDGTNANTTFIDIVKGVATVRTRYIDVRTSADILYITGGVGVGNSNGTGYTGSIVVGEANYALTSATQFQSAMMITGSFVPTSGGANFADLTIRPIINQTGGANGISRGIWVNPNLVAAADFRAIETTAGNVLFGSNFFWDNTNGRLGIGTNTPASSLQITSAATFATGIQLNNAGSIGYIWGDGSSMNIRPGATYGIQISAGSAGLIQATATTGGFRIELQALLAQPIYTYFSDNDTGIGRAAADTLTFHAGGERARFSTVGNLSIGAITDNGQRLQVYGDTLLRGSGNTAATIGLTIQNSSSVNLLRVYNSGQITIGGSSGSPILRMTESSASQDVNGTKLTFLAATNISNSTYGAFNFYRDITSTTGNFTTQSIITNITPTSGSAEVNSLLLIPTINQTGGANGITRGLYVNPTLTSAADFRAIETARGNIVFSNLPTSSAGLPSGALWNNAGVINIV